MGRFGLAPVFLASCFLTACFQTDCPETKSRLLERFTQGSANFDPDLLSPAPLGAEPGDAQAILDADPSRCVDLSAEFVQSAIQGVAGQVCNEAELGTLCGNNFDVCRRSTASIAGRDIFQCRRSCTSDDECSGIPGTRCIAFDDNNNGVIDANEGGRCDNPNLGVCQAILRELGRERCVQCDEMELLICECRSGASLFRCLAGFVGQELARQDVAQETCEEVSEGDPEKFGRCFEDLSEANSREERLACAGVKANIAVLEDGLTPDCSRYAFVQNNGALCGSADECIGGRCVVVEGTEFDAQGNPLDVAEKQSCASDCGVDTNGDGVLEAALDRCAPGVAFCSDNLRDRQGNPVDPACININDPNLPFDAENFTTACDPADPNACGPGVCAPIPIPGQGVQNRCTFRCNPENEGENARCGANNRAVCDSSGFCAPN